MESTEHPGRFKFNGSCNQQTALSSNPFVHVSCFELHSDLDLHPAYFGNAVHVAYIKQRNPTQFTTARERTMTTVTWTVTMDMDNMTEVPVDMGNMIDVPVDMENMTDVPVNMGNTTDISVDVDNITHVSVDKGNITDVFMEMGGVRDIVDSMAQVMSIVYICIGVSVILMNMFVISIFMVHMWMRSNANIIICSMSITDLLSGMLALYGGIIK